MKKLKRFLALIDNFKSGLNMFELQNSFILYTMTCLQQNKICKQNIWYLYA